MSINRIIVVFTLFLMICIPMSICAFADDVAAQEENATVEEGRNLFEDFYYRLFIKETRDFYDYVMLGTFIVGLLIVMVFQNTHYYVVKKVDVPEDVPKQYNHKQKYEHQNNYEHENNYERNNNYHKKRNYHRKKKNNKIKGDETSVS